LICDTELHTTATWSDMVAGERPAWLTAAARARHYDLMFLLDHDVPWIDDGTRVLGDRRAEHTQRLRDELRSAGRDFTLLSGSFEERERRAAELVRGCVGTQLGGVSTTHQ
jgi:nicotinamide riboside kinase